MNHSAQFVIFVDGRKLAYAEFGPRNGLPLFWFHGAPSSRLEPQLLGEAVFARITIESSPTSSAQAEAKEVKWRGKMSRREGWLGTVPSFLA